MFFDWKKQLGLLTMSYVKVVINFPCCFSMCFQGTDALGHAVVLPYCSLPTGCSDWFAPWPYEDQLQQFKDPLFANQF